MKSVKCAVADVTVYLPLDTYANAKKFISLAHPYGVLYQI
jgi:hypothetical protein